MLMAYGLVFRVLRLRFRDELRFRIEELGVRA